jgi:ATP-dependent DNA helicase RecG
MLNAVVHREYSASGSILIKMFSDRVEIISPGGLVSGIELEDIMSGYSACRNSELAEVFYSLQLIEAYGT